MSHNRLHAIQSDHENPHLLFDKLLFSSGDLPLPENPLLEVVEHGIKFSWDHSSGDSSDQNNRVMMLAYFPETKEAVFETSGSKRNELSDILLINSSLRTQPMHLYIAFGATEGYTVSDSIYLGRIN